jgi:hypothetical protein
LVPVLNLEDVMDRCPRKLQGEPTIVVADNQVLPAGDEIEPVTESGRVTTECEITHHPEIIVLSHTRDKVIHDDGIHVAYITEGPMAKTDDVHMI